MRFDADRYEPGDPFDFYLEAYKRQLVAGYAKMTSSFGLRVYMRDFDKLNPRSKSRRRRPPNLFAPWPK